MELVIITGLLFCWTLLAAFGEVIATKELATRGVQVLGG
jgi:hypothetical protein